MSSSASSSDRSWDSAGELLAAVVAEHVRRIEERLPAALVDTPDAVHRLRTAVRRLRNVLAAYKKAFDAGEVAALRERLATFGDVLGPVRDLEVRTADAADVAGALELPEAPDERLVADLRRRHDDAHAALVRWCAGEELAATTALLVRWAADPPLTSVATKPAKRTTRRALRRQARRALRAADQVEVGPLSDPSGPGFDSALERAHELRKAGRRLSHAAAAVTSGPTKALGSRAKALKTAGSRIQDALGSHRDALLLAAHARAAADAAEADGVRREPFDAVAREAERRGREALTDLPAAVVQLREASEAFP
jgi:CHAD domain-containing protein